MTLETVAASTLDVHIKEGSEFIKLLDFCFESRKGGHSEDFLIRAIAFRFTLAGVNAQSGTSVRRMSGMTFPPSHFPSVVNRDGAVVLDIDHGAIVSLNSTGGYVWERLQKGQSLVEIVHELATESGANAAIVDRDVRDFISQLKLKGLLAE